MAGLTVSWSGSVAGGGVEAELAASVADAEALDGGALVAGRQLLILVFAAVDDEVEGGGLLGWGLGDGASGSGENSGDGEGLHFGGGYCWIGLELVVANADLLY